MNPRILVLSKKKKKKLKKKYTFTCPVTQGLD